LLTYILHCTTAQTSEGTMNNKFDQLSELEIIRLAEQERSKAVGDFFAQLFSRHESANLPINPIPAK
jgi:hypothetical protein